MSNNSNRFRTCLFGGFSKEDVIKYIIKLAQERNESDDEKEELLKKIQSFKDTVAELLVEVVEVRHEIESIKKFRSESLVDMDENLTHIETATSNLRKSIDTVSEQFLTQMMRTGGTIEKLLLIIEDNCKQFDEETEKFKDMSVTSGISIQYDPEEELEDQ